MNKAGQVAVQEDAALAQLKNRLGLPGADSARPQQGSGSSTSSPQIDACLLRYLRSAGLSVDDAIEKLRQRRVFERTLPVMTISPNVVRILRCGAFVMIGSDVLRRPILYVKMGLYRASTDPEDTQKLAVVLLEYLQALAAPVDGSHVQQEVVLLVNEQASGWFEHQDLLKTPTLLTLLQKYYPELIGLVLLVDAPWSVKQAIRSNLNSNGRAKTLTHLVSKVELTKYVDVAVIPEELGGRNKAQMSPNDFCENVLRHWYCTSTVIQAEAASHTNSRPLYQMPVVTGGGVAAIDRSVSISRQLAIRQSHHNASGGNSARRAGRRQSLLNASMADTTDDGQCSVISDGDIDVADDDAFSENEGPSSAGLKLSASRSGVNNNSVVAGTTALAAELDLERQRRMALEHELAKLQLGISIDDATVTQLEAALRQIHNEVNVLTSETILRSLAASRAVASAARGASSGSSGGRGAASAEPTLHDLLVATNNAILGIVQQRQPVGAMKFGAPTERTSKSSCSLM